MTKFQDFSRLEKLSPFSQVFQELWEPCDVKTVPLDKLVTGTEDYGLSEVSSEKQNLLVRIWKENVNEQTEGKLFTLMRGEGNVDQGSVDDVTSPTEEF